MLSKILLGLIPRSIYVFVNGLYAQPTYSPAKKDLDQVAQYAENLLDSMQVLGAAFC